MRQRNLLFFIQILLWAIILSSCTQLPSSPFHSQDETKIVDENIDSACAYFYFLWGSSAEYKGLYEEALEAYEKASLCDPTAAYIREKIPVLLIELKRNGEAITWLTKYLQQFPEKNTLQITLARLLLLEDRQEEAMAIYENILALEPDNNSILLSLGLLHIEKDELDKAEQFFIKVLETSPQSYYANLYMARLASMKDELQQAENYYQQARQNNTTIELLFEIAEFYTATKQFQKALNINKEILEIDPDNEHAVFNRVKTYLLLKKNDAARKELEQLRHLNKTPGNIDLALAQIYLTNNEIDIAKDILETIHKEGPLDQGSYLLGLIYYQEKEYDKAIAVLRDISPESDEFKDGVLLQTRVFKQTKRYEEAAVYLKNLLAADTTRLPFFYSLLARFYATTNQKEKALKVLQDGHEIYPENDSILYEYAIQLENQGLHSLAMEKMIQLIKLKPDHANALNFVGYTWADNNIKLQQAFAYIKKALELKPDNGYILDSLGWVYYRLGEYEKALIHLKRARELEPDDPHIVDHLGDVYLQLGENDLALHFYQKALEKLKEDNSLGSSIKNKIRKLEKRK